MHLVGNARTVRNTRIVIPTKVGIQFFEFQSFPINCLSIECLDSRLRGNDGIGLSVFHLPPSRKRKQYRLKAL
ncbi:hypothetical protein CWI49_11670 [Neisseria meningitidis]|nr:hypothetical protein CWI49_11670 [Neisseria meningitidis]